ncbi:DNA helicase [Tanacetum coccineum]
MCGEQHIPSNYINNVDASSMDNHRPQVSGGPNSRPNSLTRQQRRSVFNGTSHLPPSRSSCGSQVSGEPASRVSWQLGRAHVDDLINNGRGPYVFKISGQLDHWIASLCLAEGEPQRTAREKFADAHIPDFKIRLYNLVGAREYELPTSDTLGAIVYEAGPKTEMDCDIVIEQRSGYPQRVNKLHPSYMLLQFPLLFIYGEDGYSKELKLVGGSGSSSATDKRLSMKISMSNCLITANSSASTDQSQIIVDEIKNFLDARQVFIFVNGHGGTGKTFLWKTIRNSAFRRNDCACCCIVWYRIVVITVRSHKSFAVQVVGI